MNFSKYIESGISVIPLLPKSKKPFITNWQRYCESPASTIEAQVWDEKYPNYNIGVCLGTAIDDDYVLGALDIDSTDKNFIDSFPPSPVRKSGKKGETRFYRFPKSMVNRNVLDKNGVGYEILLSGRQTVIPPSIHPETGKSYEWLTPDTLLNMNLKDLPVWEYVPHHDDKETTDLEVNGQFTSPDGKRCPHGSFNRAKKLCHALIAQRVTSDDAVKELLDWDERSNDVQLFSDQTRSDYAGKTPFENALSMYLGVLKSVNAKRKTKGLEPELPIIEELSIAVPKNTDLEPLPKLTESLEAIKANVIENSIVPNDVFATAAALMASAALASPNYIFGGTRLNLMGMVLGETGAGKDIVRRFLNEVLYDEYYRPFDLMGLSSYVSVPSLITTLPEQRTRIDIVDEFSDFLKASASKNAFYKAEVVTELNKLFTIGTHYYGGSKAVSRKETGECFAPCISLLAMIQPEVLKLCMNSEVTNNGFLPRLLYFFSDKVGEKNYEAILSPSEANFSKSINILKRLYPSPRTLDLSKLGKLDIGQLKPDLTQITVDNPKTASQFMSDIDNKANNGSQNEKVFYSRANENWKKISALIALSEQRTVILKPDMEMAYDLIRVLIKNSLYVLGETQSSTAIGRVIERVRRNLKRYKVVSSEKFTGLIKDHYNAKKIIIDCLVDSGDLKIVISDRNKKTYYYIGD